MIIKKNPERNRQTGTYNVQYTDYEENIQPGNPNYNCFNRSKYLYVLYALSAIFKN